MPIGFNVTSINITNITSIGNSSSFPEVMVKVNHIVFYGYLFFAICFVFATIIFITLQRAQEEAGKPKQPLHNLMNAATAATFLAIFLRAVEVTYTDFPSITNALLSDPQMYIFPISSILLAGVIWLIKRE